MMRLQAEMGLAFLFISHDIAVVERISHRTAVMYLGEIVEIGPRASIIENPQHPYTRKLMAAAPTASGAWTSRAGDFGVNPFSPCGRRWREAPDEGSGRHAH
jgi:ABC-type oligopeptide transport system ATPase subunit